MYATSLILLLAAVVTLLVGLTGGDLILIFVSIGASVGSALFLAVGVLRKESEAPLTFPWEVAAPYVRRRPRDEREGPAEPGLDVEEPLPAERTAPATARRSQRVVAIPSRGTYHLPSCRHVKGRATQRLTRAAAARRGYRSCGVCRPG